MDLSCFTKFAELDKVPLSNVAVDAADPLSVPAKIHSGLSTELLPLNRDFDIVVTVNLLGECRTYDGEVRWLAEKKVTQKERWQCPATCFLSPCNSGAQPPHYFDLTLPCF
jgi:hypothetical protein